MSRSRIDMAIRRRSAGALGACRAAVVAIAFTGVVLSAVVRGEDPMVIFLDSPCDVQARPTDPGNDAAFDPVSHHLPNLLEMVLGLWLPADPQSDPFTGSFDEQGQFVRMDMVLDGLMNPPGGVSPTNFNPFDYGDHPLYGFVEIDMDNEDDTGGELDSPHFRYLGNVARFGGVPTGSRFEDSVAADGDAFDGDFESEPHVERSGEEFHIAFLGSEFSSSDISEVLGNGDMRFDAGETWDILGRSFHRAHGYEPFSLAKGGPVAGAYVPDSHVRYRHDLAFDQTMVSLVFPLTQAAAGQLLGQAPEPINHLASDQASVVEALDDLVVSAMFLMVFPTGLAEEQIIIEWYDEEATHHLDPRDWRVTALLGSSYLSPEATGPYFVWSDVYPNVVLGDMDGSGLVDASDSDDIDEYIESEDLSDGVLDGQVVIGDFATDFSLRDVNYDGVVDTDDIELAETATPVSCGGIPAVSEWGLVVLFLTLVVVATVVFGSAGECCGGLGGASRLEIE